MFKKDKRRKSYRYYRKGKRKKLGFWAKLGSKFLWICIIFLTILLLVFVFSFYQKLNQPQAREQKETTLVRVQILNGCSKPGRDDLAQKLARRLEQIKAHNVVYEIVEMGNCDFGSIGVDDSLAKESLILDRMGDEKRSLPSEVALATATALGINPQNVIYKKLNNNYQDIALTILIGNDYRSLSPAVSK
jgi:hypothetical protein